jgi:predicted phage terminase large subunit-like protein
MGALAHVHVPGYAALLLRRTYADLSLPGALMDRAHEWLRGTGARWDDRTKTWHFPTGASLTFGYLENENDKYRYQGSELQFIGFDEATQFSETQYRYLLSRLRRLEGSSLPLRARLASNPGGLGHEWVKTRFVNPGSGPDEEPRPFIPARLEDNPHLDKAEYEKSLAQLDPVTRAQLREGDWDIAQGKLFKREWFRVVEAAPSGLKWLRHWDLAASTKQSADYTASAAVGLASDGTLFIRDMIRGRWEWPDARQVMVQAMLSEPETFQSVEDAVHGLAAIQDLQRDPRLAHIPILRVKPDRDKLSRALPWAVRAEQGWQQNQGKPWSEWRGGVALVRGPWIGSFLDEACNFTGESDGGHDDQIDSVSGSVRLFGLIQPDPAKPKPDPLEDQSWLPHALRSTPRPQVGDGLVTVEGWNGRSSYEEW